MGVGKGLLIGALGQPQAFVPDGQARIVHHREHAAHARVLVADQEADGAALVAIGHDAGGAALDAELVLELEAAKIVAASQAAIRFGKELRHEEEGDPLGAGRRVGQAGEHEMDDVGRQIVLAEGDEDLLTADQIVVLGRLRLGRQSAHVRARMRLGEAHGAGPFTAHQLRQINALQLGGAVVDQGLDRRLGQQGAEHQARVGGVPHLGHRGVDQTGQALAARRLREGEAHPAAVRKGPVGLLEAGRCPNGAPLQHGADLVPLLVEGRQHLPREPARLLDHLGHELRARRLEPGQPSHLIEAARPWS